MKLLRSIFAILVLAFACPALAQNSPPTALTAKTSASGVSSLIVQAAPVYYWNAYCASATAGLCILYNSTTVPGSSLTPALVLGCFPATTSTAIGGVNYDYIPRRASIGLVVLYSSATDCNTFTASATAFISADVQGQ